MAIRPLGNGVSLAQVAPFLPDFEAPQGWEAPADTPIPLDFVPVAGEKLVIPPTVIVPDDSERYISPIIVDGTSLRHRIGSA